MKFLADECRNLSTVDYLRELGYDVKYIQEIDPGTSDSEVLQKAFREQRILLTTDKDFGNLVFRLMKPAYGIILLRFESTEQEQRRKKIHKLMSEHTSKLKGSFIVLDSSKIRIRPLHTG